MKVILSRKGFDSSYGGCASPILPDGTMLSMPIPGGEASNLKFEDIKYGEITYLDIWDKLYSKHKTDKLYCHLDPDIRADVRVKSVSFPSRVNFSVATYRVLSLLYLPFACGCHG